jgi:aromatic amino acid transport protein AroP
MISVTHLKFRQQKRLAGARTLFPSIGYPFTNVITLVFLAGILVVMWLTPGMRVSVILIPFWLIALGIGYRLRRPAEGVSPAQAG